MSIEYDLYEYHIYLQTYLHGVLWSLRNTKALNRGILLLLCSVLIYLYCRFTYNLSPEYNFSVFNAIEAFLSKIFHNISHQTDRQTDGQVLLNYPITNLYLVQRIVNIGTVKVNKCENIYSKRYDRFKAIRHIAQCSADTVHLFENKIFRKKRHKYYKALFLR